MPSTGHGRLSTRRPSQPELDGDRRDGIDADSRDLSTPPHDVEAERAVLGSVLKNPRAIHEASDLAPEAFYDSRNRMVFAAMLIKPGLPAN
jgi:hypothetical protein